MQECIQNDVVVMDFAKAFDKVAHKDGDKTSHRLVDQLEMVQRRAARWVTGRYHNTSSVSDMLRSLDWRSLEQTSGFQTLHAL